MGSEWLWYLLISPLNFWLSFLSILTILKRISKETRKRSSDCIGKFEWLLSMQQFHFWFVFHGVFFSHWFWSTNRISQPASQPYSYIYSLFNFLFELLAVLCSIFSIFFTLFFFVCLFQHPFHDFVGFSTM